MNITYNFDEGSPLTSVIEAKYRSEGEEYKNRGRYVYDFERLVEEKLEPNTQYIRYWHGSAGILRILLIFMELKEIFIVNAVILSILLIVLLVLLLKKRAIELAISLILGLIMVVGISVPFCLECTWTFYIMIITSILAIIWKDKNERLNILFFITGIITCFLDFLTTELITILVPVLIVLVIQAKEKKITNGKKAIGFIFKSIILWGSAYICMWLAKWIIACIVLKTNAFKYITWRARKRINGQIVGIAKNELWWEAIKRNLLTLYPINFQKRISRLIAIPVGIVILEIILIRKKDLKKLWISGVIVVIGIIPYIRYAIMSNHSYVHYFFTFRSQIVSIMAIILAMIYSIDKEYWKEKIRNRRYKNGANDINSSTK